VVKVDTLINYDNFEYEIKVVNQAMEYLEKIKAIITDPSQPVRLKANQVRIEVVCGRAAEEITHFAALTHSDLIVMTTHARPSLPNLLPGSVAMKVVHLANKPVILVHPTHSEETGHLREELVQFDPKAGQQNRIVVALDGTAHAEAVLEGVIELARSIDATIYLLRIIVPDIQNQYPANYYAGDSETEEDISLEKREAAAYEYLENIRSLVVGEGLRCVCAVRVEVAANRRAEEIVAYSEKVRATFVAMATHARGNLGRMVFGSVSDGVLRQTHIPVLFFHPTHPIQAKQVAAFQKG
jgi:nucleotide-binding universal stress UspA family protein